MATIERYVLKSGATRWRVRYRMPDRRQTDRRGFTTKRDAQRFAEHVEVDMRQGLYAAPADGRVRFGTVARAWLDSKHGLKPSTRARYEITLNHALSRFDAVAIGDIRRPAVRALVADLVAAGASASSVHKAAGLLRQVLASAVADNLVATNAAAGVELPPVRAAEQRFLTPAQLHRVALAAGAHKALVYVLGTTGLRFGEAAELRWRDVDLTAGRLSVSRSVTFVSGVAEVGPPKNGTGRTVALPASAARMLTAGDADALVFPDSRGGWLRASNARRRWWAAALASAGLPANFKLHELRHTAASLAIRAGANVKVLQNMLGHRSAALTLDRYGHLYPDDLDAVAHAIDAAMTEDCGQHVGTAAAAVRSLRAVSGVDLDG